MAIKISWPKILRGGMIALLFILLAALFLHTAGTLNQDLGRHLKTGEIIWQTHSVPKVNLYSYTEPNQPFINHHWLSEVVFYGLYRAVGFNGLIIFTVLIVLLSFALIFKVAYKKNYFLLAALVSFLSIALLSERTDIRPEIFGFLFLALYLFILEKNKEKINKSIWWLLPIQFLWVNMHVSFGFGLALIFIFFIDRVWARRKIIYLAARKRKIDKYIVVVILLGLSLGAVSLLNPNGWRGAVYPLTVFNNYGYTIVENQSPFFLEKMMNNPTILFFKITLAALILSFAVNYKKMRPFYFLSAALGVALAWSAIRNFPILGFLALPILVENFARPVRSVVSNGARETYNGFFVRWDRSQIKPIARLLTILFIFGSLIGGIYYVVSNKYYLEYAKADRFGLGLPATAGGAVEFLKQNNIAGPMFNNFDIGSYLIWRSYPEQKVFVDGRPEAYSADFLQKIYIPMQMSPDVWRHYADEVYKVNYVFFAHTDSTPWGSQFLKLIAENKDWTLVYLDEIATIWARNNEVNSALIEQYGLTREKLVEQAGARLAANNFTSLLRLGSFFQTIGYDDLAIDAYGRALLVYPASKQTLLTLGILYAKDETTLQKSIDYLLKVIRFDDKYVSAYLILGDVYYKQGDFSQARLSWQRVLEIDSGNQEARYLLDNMGLVPFSKE